MSREWKVVFGTDAALAVRVLPPDVKRSVRAAVDALANDPSLGKELLRDLRGLRSYRTRRYRIVYEVDTARREVRVVAVGHRSSVYEDLVRRRLGA